MRSLRLPWIWVLALALCVLAAAALAMVVTPGVAMPPGGHPQLGVLVGGLLTLLVWTTADG